MNSLLKNKFFITLLISILLLFSFSSIVKADNYVLPDINEVFTDQFYDITSQFNYWVLFNYNVHGQTIYGLALNNTNNFYCSTTSDGYANINVSDYTYNSVKNDPLITFYLYDHDAGWYNFPNTAYEGLYFCVTYLYPNGYDDPSHFYYCNADIYTGDSQIFFQKTPLKLVGPTLTQILVEETEKVQIAEQLKIMIVGFLKYLVVLVISVIAFLKGWKFLSTQLRKA